MRINKRLLTCVVAISVLVPFTVAYALNKDSATDNVKNVSKNIVETAADAAITTKVKAMFALEKDIPSLNIKVTTKDHVVHLSGKVNTSSQAHRVVEIAQGVGGVSDVEDAGLKIGDTNSYLKDAMITARIKGKILQLAESDQISSGYNLHVETVNGEVYIDGNVAKLSDTSKIEKESSAVKNVKAVKTNINVAGR